MYNIFTIFFHLGKHKMYHKPSWVIVVDLRVMLPGCRPYTQWPPFWQFLYPVTPYFGCFVLLDHSNFPTSSYKNGILVTCFGSLSAFSFKFSMFGKSCTKWSLYIFYIFLPHGPVLLYFVLNDPIFSSYVLNDSLFSRSILHEWSLFWGVSRHLFLKWWAGTYPMTSDRD